GDAKAAGRLLGAATALREGTVGTVMGQGTAIRETIIGRLLAAERADTGLAAPRVGDRSAFAAAYTEGLRDPRAVPPPAPTPRGAPARWPASEPLASPGPACGLRVTTARRKRSARSTWQHNGRAGPAEEELSSHGGWHGNARKSGEGSVRKRRH